MNLASCTMRLYAEAAMPLVKAELGEMTDEEAKAIFCGMVQDVSAPIKKAINIKLSCARDAAKKKASKR